MDIDIRSENMVITSYESDEDRRRKHRIKSIIKSRNWRERINTFKYKRAEKRFAKRKKMNDIIDHINSIKI
jgi:hypothetical protein